MCMGFQCHDCEEEMSLSSALQLILSQQHWYIKHGERKLSASVGIHLNDGFSSPLDVRDLHDASFKCKSRVTNRSVAGGNDIMTTQTG